MNEMELDSLRQVAVGLAQDLAVEATVDYDSASGFITVKAITRSAGAAPREVERSAKFRGVHGSD
jgi:hypothetical protein